jgi:copper(I)-binding protein
MRTTYLQLILPFAIVLSSAVTRARAGDAANDMRVEDAYLLAPAPSQMNAAAFLVLRNEGTKAHVLVSVRSEAAKTAELHTHVDDSGIVRMRRLDRIDVAAHSQLAFRPGGLHVMLLGLTHRPAVGEKVTIVLTFEDGSATQVEAAVRALVGSHG